MEIRLELLADQNFWSQRSGNCIKCLIGWFANEIGTEINIFPSINMYKFNIFYLAAIHTTTNSSDIYFSILLSS